MRSLIPSGDNGPDLGSRILYIILKIVQWISLVIIGTGLFTIYSDPRLPVFELIGPLLYLLLGIVVLIVTLKLIRRSRRNLPL